MREIRFRGYNKNTGWVYGYYCGYGQIKIDGGMIVAVEPKTIGQSTGLKDKTRFPIYEGDILVDRTPRPLNWMPFKVYFSEEWSTWSWENCNGNQDCFNDSIATDCEIVGNIHDNPELMEVSND